MKLTALSTAHVVSCASGHQVAQRGGAKFSMPETSYLHSRNAKLRQQFTAQAREGLRVAEGTDAVGGSNGGAVGIGGRFGAELSRAKAAEGDEAVVDGTMVQQSRIFGEQSSSLKRGASWLIVIAPQPA